MVQHCPSPLALASVELYFGTDSEPQRTRKYNLQYDDIWGVSLRPPHEVYGTGKTIKNILFSFGFSFLLAKYLVSEIATTKSHYEALIGYIDQKLFLA